LATWSLFLPTGLCLRTPYMPLIIMSAPSDVQSYVAFCEDPSVSAIRPKRCVHCGRVHPLQRHGSYERTVWFRLRAYRIRVYRFQCGACKRTVSVLPTFVGRYQRFAWDAKEQVLLSCESGNSLETAAAELPNPAGPVAPRTVWRWRKTWGLAAHESRFWEYVLAVNPSLILPRGNRRPLGKLALWKQIWDELLPMGVSVRLLHGLYRLRQPEQCLGP
jgi:hypothetical protein